MKSLQAYLNSTAGLVLSRMVHSFGSTTVRKSSRSSRVVIELPPPKFGPIDEGIFLRVFAAAGTLDPIRAASVVAKLGYRPNFSVESPVSKTNGGRSTNKSVKSVKNKRRAVPPAGKRGGKRPASASAGASRRRPASAGGSRRGGQKNKGSKNVRPSTAGNSRSNSNGANKGMVNSHSSFLKGSITPRHRRGPMDFYWKFLRGETMKKK